MSSIKNDWNILQSRSNWILCKLEYARELSDHIGSLLATPAAQTFSLSKYSNNAHGTVDTCVAIRGHERGKPSSY
jgi:hypothetical protein